MPGFARSSYDFDGTLAKGDCAQHGLMPAIGIRSQKKFWDEVKSKAKENDGDEILSYLGLLVEYANKSNPLELSPESLNVHGRSIPLFPGVSSWFKRIDCYAQGLEIELEHYIISSGLTEMIKGTEIGGNFKKIYACQYSYDKHKRAVWPSLSINYTTKTQFLFRINKGVLENWDNEGVNRFIEIEKREIPFSQMIYFGDGDTDIPAMKMVRYQGGFSLAVFDKDKWPDDSTQEKIRKLIAEERASYVVPADYDEGSQLDVTVKGLFQLFRRKNSSPPNK